MCIRDRYMGNKYRGSMASSINVDYLLRAHRNHKGVSLYEHLAMVINQISKDAKSKDCFENFEKIMDFVEKNHFKYKAPLSDHEVNHPRKVKSEIHEWLEDSIAFLRKLPPRSIPAPPLPKDAKYAPNLLLESRLFETVGIYFGEEETYLLNKAMLKLLNETNAVSVRFWGKILGRSRSYWVIEGQVPADNPDPLPLPYERFGQGVNALTYWVANDVQGHWHELPAISPEHIKRARTAKHIMTGHLNAKVDVYPPFPGVEKHYLKAQIVRITYSTVIAPNNFYKANDEDATKIEISEEFAMPGTEELKSLENWVHVHPNILEAGRITHLEPQVGPEEDKDEVMNKILTADPIKERLRPLSEDNPFTGFEANWLVRVHGDTQVFNMADKDEGKSTTYAVLALRPLTWPGACVIANNNTWSHIYVGYGIKAGGLPFFPIAPNDIMVEGVEQDEMPEPNPKNPLPEPLEPNSDDEGKKKDENGNVIDDQDDA
eukprot:TRINITY_DN11459_c0_g1_i8.p1 TRINITY_DN11459_c0_g1~~TRINITY_DN11459_c0_g1_i8.p1  ORF type:complete len:489 (-),score=113.27 TRINITY_DN11459_c0_g1_i8:797-2263(-)